MGLQVYIVLSSHLAWVWEGFLKYTDSSRRERRRDTYKGRESCGLKGWCRNLEFPSIRHVQFSFKIFAFDWDTFLARYNLLWPICLATTPQVFNFQFLTQKSIQEQNVQLQVYSLVISANRTCAFNQYFDQEVLYYLQVLLWGPASVTTPKMISSF